ncbi:MAG TPA: hypothetical protein VGC79_34515 [Polyangiaceae bacterium]
MRPRRTAIVPNMIWGTAIASIVPSQLVACGGSASVGDGESADHGGSGGHSGHRAGNAAGEGGSAGKHSSAGHGGFFIALAAAAFGGKSQ